MRGGWGRARAEALGRNAARREQLMLDSSRKLRRDRTYHSKGRQGCIKTGFLYYAAALNIFKMTL